MLGILVTVSAAFVMVRVDLFIKNTSWDNLKQLLGNSLLIMGSFSASFSIVLQKIMLDGGIPPLTMTSYSFLVACIIMTIIATPFYGDIRDLALVPWEAWAGVIYSAVLPSAIAYSLSAWALAQLTPSIQAMYICLQPIFSALLGYFIQHIAIEWFHIVGALGIIVGLIIVVIAKARETQTNKKPTKEQGKQGDNNKQESPRTDGYGTVSSTETDNHSNATTKNHQTP